MKKWGLWIGLLVALVIAGLGLTTAYSWWLAKPVTSISATQTQRVTRGPLKVTVRAYGHVAAPDPQVVNAAIGGRVVELVVKEGDRVAVGDLIARLDAVDLEAAVRAAEAAVETSRAQLARAKVAPSPEYIGTLEAAVAVAETRLVTAQAAVKQAQANLSAARQGATAEQIGIAQKRIDEARNALTGDQASRDAICARVRGDSGWAECAAAEARVKEAEGRVTIAELELQALQAGPRPATIQAAQAALQAAEGQVKTAEAQVAQAQADLARAKVGPMAEEIAIAEAQLVQRQVDLQEARRRVKAATVVAPIAGTVIAVGANVGQTVSTSTPLVTLQDLASLTIEALVNEVYIGRVAEGQKARVRLEADATHNWEGTVRQVGVIPSLSAGLANYPVNVTLTGDAPGLRVGQGAEVEIIVLEKPDALLAPREALRLDQGRWTIQTASAGRLLNVPVELGATQGRLVEVLSGVEEGQEVVTKTGLLTERKDYTWLPFGIMVKK